MADPKLIGTLVKIADPEKGLSEEQAFAICKALSVEPKPEKEPPAD